MPDDSESQKAAAAKPIRAIGWLGLTAIAVNSMVGAGIFALPANVAQLLGPVTIVGYVIAGLAVLLVVACFAEAGSLFEQSGGPYVYAYTALGPFWGFQSGWALVLSRVAGGAAISNTFASYLSYVWPAAGQGVTRVLVISVLIGGLAWVNYRGVRPGVLMINTLTIGKLIPLTIFCLVGLFFVNWNSFALSPLPDRATFQQAILLLMFAFGGFEYASVPSEEVFEPRRTLPKALMTAVASVVLLYLSIQVVAMGTVPNLAKSSAPLTSSARAFMGPLGALLLTVGAILSTSGTNSSAIFVGPRTLYAMAKEGQLPERMGRLHPKYQTPGMAIVSFAIATWALAAIGTFTLLAAVAALARIFYYTTTCVSIPVLRRKMPTAERFKLPGGAFIPVLATIVCLWLFAGSTREQAIDAIGAGVVGAVLYFGIRLAAKNSVEA